MPQRIPEISTCKSRALLFYADRGFSLFPLSGKVPVKGYAWREAPFDPLPDYAGNYGVVLREDDLVIDIDPRNGGEASAKALLPRIGIEAGHTFSVQTGGGGTHLYLKKPPELKIRKKVAEYPGIDFLSEGCYVVGAGSIHPDTKREYLLSGQDDLIIAAPAELLEITARTPVSASEAALSAYTDDEQTKGRYISYLQNAPAAVEGQGGDQTTFSVACAGRDHGLSPESTFFLMMCHYNPKCVPPWEEDAMRVKVENAYKYAEGTLGSIAPTLAFPVANVDAEVDDKRSLLFHRNGSHQVITDLYNTILIFAPTFPLQGLLAKDMFSQKIVFIKPAPWHAKHEIVPCWNDDEAKRCRAWLSANIKFQDSRRPFEPTQDIMHDAVLNVAYQYQFHPVKQYWEALTWDGHKRVHNWMSTYLGAADDDYTRAVGLKTLVACVKRVYEPGCKFDYIPVLEGPQGTGKSTAWCTLCGEQWFGDTPIDIKKEWGIVQTFGKLMTEWAEMEVFRKAGTQAMKSFLSSRADTVRLPYSRSAVDIKRSGIFVGTFNPERDKDIGWLHDTTGNRRYWVISTGVNGRIRNDKLAMVRDQMWAEAIVLYRAGTPIYFEDSKVIQMAQGEQSKRMGRDAWYDAVDIWLRAPHNVDRNVITGDEIFRECIGGNLTQFNRPEQIRLSRIMEDLCWEKGTWYHKALKKPVNAYRQMEILE